MNKIIPIYISLLLAFYNTSKAGSLKSIEAGAEALTWYYIAIFQIIILVVYEVFRILTVRIENREL